jgi:EAL domain-containing protein (putative c-di-GMP-specific phosphodiesterase class I)
VLKIDRSFVSRIDGTANHDAVIRTIIALGHALGMTIVAEGVETESHMALLQSLNCNYAQGYLISRPVGAAAALQLLLGGPVSIN